MKIGELEYEDDGTTIVYEETELINKEKFEVTLNKLRRTRYNNYSTSYSRRSERQQKNIQ